MAKTTDNGALETAWSFTSKEVSELKERLEDLHTNLTDVRIEVGKHSEVIGRIDASLTKITEALDRGKDERTKLLGKMLLAVLGGGGIGATIIRLLSG